MSIHGFHSSRIDRRGDPTPGAEEDHRGKDDPGHQVSPRGHNAMHRVVLVDTPSKECDMHPVDSHGDLCDIRSSLTTPFRIDDFRESLYEALDNLKFDHDNDFFLVFGRVLNVSMAISFAFRRYGRLNLLIWSAIEQQFIIRTLKA